MPLCPYHIWCKMGFIPRFWSWCQNLFLTSGPSLVNICWFPLTLVLFPPVYSLVHLWLALWLSFTSIKISKRCMFFIWRISTCHAFSSCGSKPLIFSFMSQLSFIISTEKGTFYNQWWKMAGLTLLRARGAASGVLDEVDSFAVSEVELSDELLLESSLVGRRVANCRMEDTRSLGSLCSSLWPSWRWRWVRSLVITCDKDIPNACGAFSETIPEKSERAVQTWPGTTHKLVQYSCFCFFDEKLYREISH